MLNDTKIRNNKPRERDYKLTDFDGLYLLICKNGSKLWRFAYRFEGKQKWRTTALAPPRLEKRTISTMPASALFRAEASS
jgi:hypothetical protein